MRYEIINFESDDANFTEDTLRKYIPEDYNPAEDGWDDWMGDDKFDVNVFWCNQEVEEYNGKLGVNVYTLKEDGEFLTLDKMIVYCDLIDLDFSE